jgi:hypothetical protein
MVTAAVYNKLCSMQKHFHLSTLYWAGLKHYTSFYNFAVFCVFVKQSLSPLNITYTIGTHFSEVTELFCRIPLALLIQPP